MGAYHCTVIIVCRLCNSTGGIMIFYIPLPACFFKSKRYVISLSPPALHFLLVLEKKYKEKESRERKREWLGLKGWG
jgi:hypothetical protein